jgi:hypothetical protein
VRKKSTEQVGVRLEPYAGERRRGDVLCQRVDSPSSVSEESRFGFTFCMCAPVILSTPRQTV